MKRLKPLLCIAGGLLIVFGGFIYDVMFAGIPYQDPTPEMLASYAHHAGIASKIRWFGVAVFLIGWVLGVIRFWPLLFIMGGGLLAIGGFEFAAIFASKPQEAHFVRIASMLGWCGLAVFLFGMVIGVIRRVKRKQSLVRDLWRR